MPWWWGYTETVSPRPPRLHRISTIRVVMTVGRALPIFPDERTFSKSVGMSQR